MTCEDSTTAQSCNNNNNHHAKDQLLHYIYEGFAQRRPRPSWPIVFFFFTEPVPWTLGQVPDDTTVECARSRRHRWLASCIRLLSIFLRSSVTRNPHRAIRSGRLVGLVGTRGPRGPFGAGRRLESASLGYFGSRGGYCWPSKSSMESMLAG